MHIHHPLDHTRYPLAGTDDTIIKVTCPDGCWASFRWRKGGGSWDPYLDDWDSNVRWPSVDLEPLRAEALRVAGTL